MVGTDLSPTAQQSTTQDASGTTGAEVVIRTLAANGVEYLFLNPGTDTAPIQEAIVALGQRGERVPTIVSCLYENVALAAAHGYFEATRRPQAVMVHVDSGTQNLGGNLHNAQRAEAGVLIMSGRTPLTQDGTVPGGRDRPIQWTQDEPDQAGIVRGYVKWTHDAQRADTLGQVVTRALQVAASEPAGPVYLTLGREVLMAPTPVGSPPAPLKPLITPQPDMAALEELAGWLADAEVPFALPGRLGRNPSAVAPLVELMDLIGMPASERGGPLNVPLTHPLWLAEPKQALTNADVVLLLDADVPWVPRLAKPRAGARVAQIDLDPTKTRMVLWNFPVDLPIQADSSKALPLLLGAVRRLATPERRQRWEARRARLVAQAEQHRAAARERVAGLAAKRPLAVEWVAACLGETLPREAILLEEAVTNSEPIRQHCRREEPGTLFHATGAGLGWGMGASVGMKLARPDRTVAAVVGDGTFIFSSPIAALYAGQQAGAPFLTVVLNNGGYNASKNPVVSLFPQGASVQANAFPGVRFQQPPDFSLLARACHAYGERVDDPAEVVPAIRRGLDAVASGQCAVLDMVVQPI